MPHYSNRFIGFPTNTRRRSTDDDPLASHKNSRYSIFGGTDDAVFLGRDIICANPHLNRGINPESFEKTVDANPKKKYSLRCVSMGIV
jgi:hypothetical protein